ncbi:Hint domain-containing protein [Streptomyces sp. NBC_00322]|uniref:Hint domain-containing protein n=1 Tax=Streptomyces sp. NBC_00322 TaxID=2975712 RepID=UPI002E27EFE9|nr:Hint domain-containing protein [Streptomyces sp. NBC_00322]
MLSGPPLAAGLSANQHAILRRAKVVAVEVRTPFNGIAHIRSTPVDAARTVCSRKVERLITTEHDKDFVTLKIRNGKQTGSIKATELHPFWVASERAWIEAGHLKPSMTLRTPDGSLAVIESVREWHKQRLTHDLTVSVNHSYYVLAGATPLLVHNCGPMDFNFRQIQDRIAVHTLPLHGHGTPSVGTKFAADVDEDILFAKVLEGVNEKTKTGKLDETGNHEHIFQWDGAGANGENYVRVWMTPNGQLGGMYPIASP